MGMGDTYVRAFLSRASPHTISLSRCCCCCRATATEGWQCGLVNKFVVAVAYRKREREREVVLLLLLAQQHHHHYLFLCPLERTWSCAPLLSDDDANPNPINYWVGW